MCAETAPLPPLLSHNCTLMQSSNLFAIFADDTTVVGYITNRDNTDYWSEVTTISL